ncbi:MAG: hypothetical protein PHY30_00505 [Candidatus Pacebacteria bacterium]|nr:hypothetical protein [Candidatus Paceibacterota bacterium]
MEKLTPKEFVEALEKENRDIRNLFYSDDIDMSPRENLLNFSIKALKDLDGARNWMFDKAKQEIILKKNCFMGKEMERMGCYRKVHDQFMMWRSEECLEHNFFRTLRDYLLIYYFIESEGNL